MRAECVEAVAGKLRGRILVAVDNVTPAGKRPRRCPDMNGCRKTFGERVKFGRGQRGQNAAAAIDADSRVTTHKYDGISLA